jgi:alpha-L-rhamnosidase
MLNRLLFLLALGLCVATSLMSAAESSVIPVELRCEYRHNPLGIDEPRPRLSWRLEAVNPRSRALRQTAFQIIVSSTEENARAGSGDLWDSGKVSADRTSQIAYAGRSLNSGQQAYWRVRVWDQAGQAGGWSETATWTMGLLRAADWKAKWIGIGDVQPGKDPASPYWNLKNSSWIEPAEEFRAADVVYRLSFEVPTNRRLVDASAVVGGDRGGDLFVNGTRIGPVTRYGRPAVLQLTAGLKPGRNVVAVRTERQAHNKTPGLIGAVRLAFDAGQPLLIPTNAAWRVSTSAGPGWQQADFDDSRWANARVAGPYGMAPWGEVGFSEERRLPAILLRKPFRADSAVKRATAYLSGLGLSELYINGAKVGDDVLSPGLTDYDKRALYVTYDITSLVRPGPNAIGVLLGNGRFYAPRAQEPVGMRSFGTPRLLLHLDIEFTNGTRQQIVSDETWTMTDKGPIRANNEFDGEEYDAAMELPGWATPGFDDKSWTPVKTVAGPKGVLAAQMAEPLQVIETLKPVKVSEIGRGVYVFDMGQNMVGWCRLAVSGPKGTRVTLRHAETLNQDGTLYVENLRSARALDTYTLKGGGREVWEPRFTYHGFRYVELRGYPGRPALETLEGRVVHDAVTPVADFTSSDSLLNQLHKNVYWGVRGNYRSIPTDCPQRDERQGWLGDRSIVSWSESYLFDVAAFYSKWETDIEDAQRSNGSIPDVAPAYWTLYNDGLTWPSTFVLVPNMLHAQYGDLRVLQRHYPAMRKWIDYMSGYLKDGLMPKNTYGDWCVPPESPELVHSKDPARQTDPTLISTAYFYSMLTTLDDDAKWLEKPSDAAAYEGLAARVKTAFIQRFFRPEMNQFDNGTQTSSILPLAFGMIPEGKREQVSARLVRKIEEESGRHIGVGLIGAQWLMRVLTENGRADLAYAIAT